MITRYTCPARGCEVAGHFTDEPGFCSICLSDLVGFADIYYRPPWYPNRDPRHNPWGSNGETGSAQKTLYAEWVDSLPPGELQRLIDLHHHEQRKSAAAVTS